MCKSSRRAQEAEKKNCLLHTIQHNTAKRVYQLTGIYELCIMPELREECMLNSTRLLERNGGNTTWINIIFFFSSGSIYCRCENYSSRWSKMFFFNLPAGFECVRYRLPAQEMCLTIWNPSHPKARVTQLLIAGSLKSFIYNPLCKKPETVSKEYTYSTLVISDWKRTKWDCPPFRRRTKTAASRNN